MTLLTRKTTLSVLAAGALAAPAFAGPDPVLAPEPAATTPTPLTGYEKMWSRFVLYKNDENPVIQEFALQGRIQLQYAGGDSDQGHYDSGDRPEDVRWGDTEVRRWRLGFKSKLFRQWKLEGQIDVNPDWDPFYRQIYDLYLVYAPSDALNIGVGKFKANQFGIEQLTSSKEILTMERTLLSNQLFPGELTGLRINGKKNNWIYSFNLYSGDITQEFSDFNTGTIFQAGIGYDFHQKLGMDKAIVRLDFQHSDTAANGRKFGGEPRLTANASGTYESALSLNGNFEKGKWGLQTDILGAQGRGTTGDVWGIILLPSYYLTPGLQLVGRYQYANGENDGLRVQSRYERLAPFLTDGGRGENYHAFYLGLNYYLYGHKLKLMAGAEYHRMDNGNDAGGKFEGVTGIAGIRMFF